MKVYAVQTIDTDDCVTTVKTEVFSTREKAKEYFGEQVQLYKDMLDTDTMAKSRTKRTTRFLGRLKAVLAMTLWKSTLKNSK